MRTRKAHGAPYQAPAAAVFPAPVGGDAPFVDDKGRLGSERFDPLDANRALGAGNSNLPQPITSTALPTLLRAIALPDTGKIVMEIERDNIPADGNTMVPMKLRLFDRDGKPWTQGTEVIIKTTRGRLRLPDASPIEPPRNELRVAVRNGEASLFLITTHEPGDALLYAQSGNVVVEGKVTMLPDKRPMIAVGVLEGALNLRRIDATKLSQPRTNDAFELEIRRIQPLGTSSDGKTDFGARSAFFLKGVVKGDYLLTLAYDSEKRVRDRVFRDIQPDQFYPIYGDSSLRGFDAQTSQRLYVRFDKEKSFFLYGDFNTASTTPARQLGSYSRSVTGVKEHYEDEFVAANAWATRDNVRRIADEQPARGISGPYALTSTQGISGSERVEVLTRDRNQPSVILKTVQMARFSDYEFEPFSGNVIFKAPIPSADENFNPQSVRVTYEVEQGGPKFWLGGVDGQWKVRDDLWTKAQGYKQHAEFVCVAPQVACYEVQLVWMGQEYQEGGWRHANPYIGIAEQMSAKIDRDLLACAPPPAPLVAAAPALAPKPVIVPIVERFTLSADALFLFAKAGRADMLPEGRRKLDEFASRVKQLARVDRISLSGYTDRLGTRDYNARLSQARAATVKAYLVEHGVAAAVIQSEGRGSANPVVMCPDQALPKLTACLQSNRRVEIDLAGALMR